MRCPVCGGEMTKVDCACKVDNSSGYFWVCSHCYHIDYEESTPMPPRLFEHDVAVTEKEPK